MRSVMLLTSDGKSVRWPFCATTESTTSLSYDQIKALRNPVAIDRIMAHEHLLYPQITKLYGGSRSALKRGVRLVRVAKKIHELELRSLCEGLGEAILVSIVTARGSAADIRSELLKYEGRPRAVAMDEIDYEEEDRNG